MSEVELQVISTPPQSIDEEEELELVEVQPSSETVEQSTYLIKPTLNERFKSQSVKDIIQTILTEELSNKVYTSEDAKVWTKTISNRIRDKVRQLHFRRYKILVNVLLGEQKGAGFKTGFRCLWDSECDNYSSDVFMNETIFCLAAVFGIYSY